MIKIDLKTARLPLALYGSVFLIYLALLAFYPEAITFDKTQFDTYKSNFFYWSDFFCPLTAVLCILMQLGNTLEKRSFEFLCSLPESIGIIGRWCFTVCAVILPVYLTGTLVCLLVEAQEIFSFWELLYLSGANLAFYSTLSLLLMIIFRQSFYVFSIVCGFMFADLSVGDKFLFEYSSFLNISCNMPAEAVEDNRMAYYIISAALLLISTVFVKARMLKRFNKMR